MKLPKRVKVDWRKKGEKKPDGVVLCGRPGKYSNPFVVGESFTPDYPGAVTTHVPDKETACKCFRVYARVRLASEPTWLDPLYEAEGLACPGCDPSDPHCHTEIILELMAANRPVSVSDTVGDCATAHDSAQSGHGTQQTEQGVGEGGP